MWCLRVCSGLPIVAQSIAWRLLTIAMSASSTPPLYMALAPQSKPMPRVAPEAKPIPSVAPEAKRMPPLAIAIPIPASFRPFKRSVTGLPADSLDGDSQQLDMDIEDTQLSCSDTEIEYPAVPVKPLVQLSDARHPPHPPPCWKATQVGSHSVLMQGAGGDIGEPCSKGQKVDAPSLLASEPEVPSGDLSLSTDDSERLLQIMSHTRCPPSPVGADRAALSFGEGASQVGSQVDGMSDIAARQVLHGNSPSSRAASVSGVQGGDVAPVAPSTPPAHAFSSGIDRHRSSPNEGAVRWYSPVSQHTTPDSPPTPFEGQRELTFDEKRALFKTEFHHHDVIACKWNTPIRETMLSN